MTDDEMWLELELEPGDEEEGETYVRDLEAEALDRYPEIWQLGNFGDPAFEDMLEAAMDVLDGSADDKLKLELDWSGV